VPNNTSTHTQQHHLADRKPDTDHLDIPAFLRVENRKHLTPEQQARLNKIMDAARTPEKARADLRAMQRETQREKSRVRIECLLAKKSGAAARLPLSGKAAIAAIKGEDF
jgi:hypothetical protein